MDTGERIRALRTLAGLHQSGVAAAIGLSQRTFSDLERGARHLRFSEAISLCGELGVTLNQLAGIEPIEV